MHTQMMDIPGLIKNILVGQIIITVGEKQRRNGEEWVRREFVSR